MDLENPNRPQTALKLDEKQKRTVRALRRQISSHSTRSTAIDGDHFAKLSEEEIILLRKIVETFTSNQRDAELTGDEVDGKGRKVDRNWSIESYLSGSSNRGSGTFVNPGRFYVRVTQENVKAVEQVCIEIDNEESKNKPTTNGYGNLSGRHSFDNKIESKYKCYYGYSVAVTKQSHEAIVVRNSYVTGALPEGVTNGTKFSFTDRPSWNKASGLKHLPPRERFKRAVHLVMDNLKMRPRKMDKDFSELWRKRGNATWLGIFFTVVAIGAFFADIATDLKVAADHFRAGSNWWGSFTVMFVLLPSIIINLVSFFWYKEDEKIGRRPKSGWKVVKLTHFFLVGPIER